MSMIIDVQTKQKHYIIIKVAASITDEVQLFRTFENSNNNHIEIYIYMYMFYCIKF
jgi:hypothetical protein